MSGTPELLVPRPPLPRACLGERIEGERDTQVGGSRCGVMGNEEKIKAHGYKTAMQHQAAAGSTYALIGFTTGHGTRG